MQDEAALRSGSASPGDPPEDREPFEPSAASQLEASQDPADFDDSSAAAYQGYDDGDAAAASGGPGFATDDDAGGSGVAAAQQAGLQQRATGEAAAAGASVSGQLPGAYNAADFKHLNVTDDVMVS